MSTNGDNITEDAEMAECDGDKVVTMMDVLQEQQEFEEDANAVLGASDDKNCTYPKGYIKRQALYACLTCCSVAKEDPTKRAGVCLACSLSCHENHELIELYTKRNFRCDCGNPKFTSHLCQFTPTKPDVNEDNIYNQNFSGLYCVCHRPYPDPEATLEDDMIQCIICEDWLHASHLEATVPSNDHYAEMICKGCMEKNEFLHDYTELAVNVETVDVITFNGNDSICNGDLKKLPDSEVADEKTINTDDEMIHDEIDKSAKLLDNVETGSIEISCKAANDKLNGIDIEMTEKVDKNEQQSKKNAEGNETVDHIDSTIEEREHKEFLNTEISIKQADDAASKIEHVHDDQNISLDNENQNTEQKLQEIATDAEESDEQKKDNSSIDDKTLKPNDNIETTDMNSTKPIQTNCDLTEAENEQSNNKPECNKELETNDEINTQNVTLEQGEEQTLEETTTRNEQETSKAEKSTDNSESSKEGAKKSDDQRLDDLNPADKSEPTTNEEETEDQQLLDDLNELTSDEQDPKKANAHEDTKEEDKGEPITAQTTEETKQDTEERRAASEETSKDQTIPENSEESAVKEPNETDSNNIEITQSKKIADTSQNVPTETENNDKTDAVMNAIDEILKESSEAKSDTEDGTISTTEVLKAKDDNETVDSVVTDKLDDEDISKENNKPSDLTEQTESKDIEMTVHNENNQNKVEKEVAEFENKEIVKTNKSNETDIENMKTSVDESKQSEAISDKEMNESLDENSTRETTISIEAEYKSNESQNIDESSDNENKVPILTEITNENKRKLDPESDEILSKKVKLDEEKCCSRPKNIKRIHKGATFWPSSFRQKLCTCGECISMYKNLSVLFLTDNEDTVTAYESLGKENIGISQYEKGLEALSSLGRIQQINALTEYNKMRDKLLDFLKSFKDRKEIVKEEDIKAFFAGMKPKREPDGVYFCR